MYQEEHEEAEKQKIEEEKQRIEEAEKKIEEEKKKIEEAKKKIDEEKQRIEEAEQKIEEAEDNEENTRLYPEYDARLNRDMRIRIQELEEKVNHMDYALDVFFDKQKTQAMFTKYNPFSEKYKGRSWMEYFKSIRKEETK